MIARLENAVVTSTADHVPLAKLPSRPSTCVLVIPISFPESKPLLSGKSITFSVSWGGRLVKIHSLGMVAACRSFFSATIAVQCGFVDILSLQFGPSILRRELEWDVQIDSVHSQIRPYLSVGIDWEFTLALLQMSRPPPHVTPFR